MRPMIMARLMGADSRIVEDGFYVGIRKSWHEASRIVVLGNIFRLEENIVIAERID